MNSLGSNNMKRRSLPLPLPKQLVLLVCLISGASTFQVPSILTPQRTLVSSPLLSPFSSQRIFKNPIRTLFSAVADDSYIGDVNAATVVLEGEEIVESPLTTTDLNPLSAWLTKMGMSAFIISQCLSMPLALFPIYLLRKINIISERRKNILSLRAGQFCSRWGLRLIPFCKVEVEQCKDNLNLMDKEDGGSVWVCNHTSMLDVFILLAMDKKIRGRRKRPMKILYWKDLEKNPICNIMFKMSGFIPVNMKANAAGEANEYDRSGMKTLFKASKEALNDGFDIGILPEGQPNPTPENGLLPIFSGAYTLARMSRRPIRMLALHGLSKLWHPLDDMGAYHVTGRRVKINSYPGKVYQSAEEFENQFREVVGHFGTYGTDLPSLASSQSFARLKDANSGSEAAVADQPPAVVSSS